ncbi:hypothetical protein [Streptomyces ficellus]|uniref:Uncharacterized protein n=1 Tax=Streptomyces ficellus TaxID=1977088 RepID=A0A6I6FGI1_9ACTN|nr:hypothetical protein [Streptomyces ficellus]QGV82191.1 hypothetical protein EIZ62_30985 [Streptomyces ficellus]
MAGTAFPDDLRAAQTRLHQATAELAALCRTLPWSVEPLDGWPGREHPHTGAVTGGRAPSRGWTEEEREAVDRLRARCAELSLEVAGHPFWQQVETGERVRARSALKHATRSEAFPGAAEAA